MSHPACLTNLRRSLIGLVFVGLMFTPSTQANDSGFHSDADFEVKVQILVKQFYISMRDKSSDKLRHIVDPEYLTQYELSDDRFQISTIPVTNVYDVRISEDNTTVLCQIGKTRNTVAVVVLQIRQRQGELYLLPPQPPAETSGKVTPWSLHAELSVAKETKLDEL